MALPALIPVIMMGGRIIGRIASKRLASQLAGKLGKGQRIVNKPASQAKNVPNVTSVNQAKNLKPTTKVVGKGTKPASMQSGAPKSPPKPLRADPKNKPASAGTQTGNSKTTAAGTPTQRRIAGAGVTAASLATLIPKKESGKSQATTKSGPSKKTTVSDAQKRGQVRTRPAANGKNNVKSFKDYKSVAAAQKNNSDFFMGKDGKKKLAVTKEQLQKSGLSLNAMANKVRAGSSINQLIAKRK